MAAAPYAKGPGDTLLCPQCMLYNHPAARYCDQCGFPLMPDHAAVYGDGLVRCPLCPNGAEMDSIFCDACGARLPHSAADAAQAAAAATSSAGRQPYGGDVSERYSQEARTAYLAGRRMNSERAAQLAPPPLTGDSQADQARAWDHLQATEHLWERLDELARRARMDLSEWPSGEDLGAVQRAEADADQVWAARCQAKAEYERLEERYSGRSRAGEQDALDRSMGFGAHMARERSGEAQGGWTAAEAISRWSGWQPGQTER